MALSNLHPAVEGMVFPLAPESVAAILASDVKRGDVMVNLWGHLTGWVAATLSTEDDLTMVTFGKPSGSWSTVIASDSLVLVAV